MTPCQRRLRRSPEQFRTSSAPPDRRSVQRQLAYNPGLRVDRGEIWRARLRAGGAGGGSRTRMAFGRGILSPLRLPVSPRPLYQGVTFKCLSCLNSLPPSASFSSYRTISLVICWIQADYMLGIENATP